MDLMQDLRRTCYCGEVTKAGETVVVGGFVQNEAAKIFHCYVASVVMV